MSVVSALQVAAVREGMSSIVPVPLLSLYTAKMVEMAVCGYEEVDIHMLKKVVRCVCVLGVHQILVSSLTSLPPPRLLPHPFPLYP